MKQVLLYIRKSMKEKKKGDGEDGEARDSFK